MLKILWEIYIQVREKFGESQGTFFRFLLGTLLWQINFINWTFMLMLLTSWRLGHETYQTSWSPVYDFINWTFMLMVLISWRLGHETYKTFCSRFMIRMTSRWLALVMMQHVGKILLWQFSSEIKVLCSHANSGISCMGFISCADFNGHILWNCESIHIVAADSKQVVINWLK